jgi:hypothetical protein
MKNVHANKATDCYNSFQMLKSLCIIPLSSRCVDRLIVWHIVIIACFAKK